MLLLRTRAPIRAAAHVAKASCAASPASLNVLDVLRASIAASTPTLATVRHASHAAQGRANGVKNGPGKRLGAKKTGEQYVVPGNIIYKQRGTLWYPGENAYMGRDHTIHAGVKGFVKYYRDPLKHPKRKYIGVVFDRNDTLPRPLNAPRARRLNLLAVPRQPEDDTFAAGFVDDLTVDQTPGKESTVRERPRKDGRVPVKDLKIRPGYMFREANWQIGRAPDRAGVDVKKFVKGDRWAAWRKASVRAKTIREKIAIGRRKGGSKKQKNKK
ncbi:mitochondrial 54S ribosomal protein bL27m [Phyllosticta citribraziliensis]|uniref:Large ribosomal subunit protein bL27m n=1 Tax=Phyllosticta citribraziliensis TaxID=989973 RepID=A0ABR1MEB8_9PEZI